MFINLFINAASTASPRYRSSPLETAATHHKQSSLYFQRGSDADLCAPSACAGRRGNTWASGCGRSRLCAPEALPALSRPRCALPRPISPLSRTPASRLRPFLLFYARASAEDRPLLTPGLHSWARLTAWGRRLWGESARTFLALLPAAPPPASSADRRAMLPNGDSQPLRAPPLKAHPPMSAWQGRDEPCARLPVQAAGASRPGLERGTAARPAGRLRTASALCGAGGDGPERAPDPGRSWGGRAVGEQDGGNVRPAHGALSLAGGRTKSALWKRSTCLSWWQRETAWTRPSCTPRACWPKVGLAPGWA